MGHHFGSRRLPVTLLLLLAGPLCLAAPHPPTTGPLVIDQEGSFFVGGREQSSKTLVRGKSTPGTVTVDQMYVRYQIPHGAAKRPNLVLIHGCCLTGKTWGTTPDGRMGWEEYFVRRGFATYVIDQSWRGRSAWDPSAVNAVADSLQPLDTLPLVNSVSHEGAWVLFRFGPSYGEAYPGMKFPVSAAADLWKQMVPDFAAGLPKPNPTVPELALLVARIGPSVLISHSQSGIYPFQTFESNRRNIAAIIAIEPAACPDPKGDLTSYRGLPILVLFGDHLADSPVWARILQGCRDSVAALKAAGARAEVLVLPEAGIQGNSHMLMQDSNNLEIADRLTDWMARTSH